MQELSLSAVAKPILFIEFKIIFMINAQNLKLKLGSPQFLVSIFLIKGAVQSLQKQKNVT